MECDIHTILDSGTLAGFAMVLIVCMAYWPSQELLSGFAHCSIDLLFQEMMIYGAGNKYNPIFGSGLTRDYVIQFFWAVKRAALFSTEEPR